MAPVEFVHPVPAEDAPAWFATMSTTFLEPPIPADRLARLQKYWDAPRRYGVRDRDRYVATLGSHERTVTVPGGNVRADALTMVTVAATHRRRGLLTQMLTASLQEARDRGEAVSILMAAEWAIYGRFGYSPAAWRADLTIDPRRPDARIPAAGEVRQAGLDEFAQLAPPVFDRAAAQRAGNINRPAEHWDFLLGLDGTPTHPDRILIVTDGGYLMWDPAGELSTGGAGAVELVELIAATDEAYRALWAYLLNMDLVGELRAKRRAVDEPLRWLLGNGRVVNPVKVQDGLWLRLLDVPGALAARRYCAEGRVVLDVVDDAPGGYAAGRFALDGGPDGASCTLTREPADLRLDQRTLASAYLGGISLAAQRVARPVEELTPGATARLDAMLRTPLAPWPITDF